MQSALSSRVDGGAKVGLAVNRLSARRVQTLQEPGRHPDGGNLYLVVDAGGAKRWVLLYRLNGKRREMGLGSAGSVPLAKARELAAKARSQIADGIDPIDDKKACARKVEAPKSFAEIANTYMADHEQSWRNAKHRAQWEQTLQIHGAHIWKMPVSDIQTEDVLGVL